jgi:hypothetical protein
MVKSGQVWAGLITCTDHTGALIAPTVGPVGALYVNGVANGAAVTITGSNPYKWSVTLPALTAGDCVEMYLTATIGGIATASVVATDVSDTKRVSDLQDVAAGAAMTLADDAITAGKFDESTAYPIKSADTGATQIARVGADADTLETLSDQIDHVQTLGSGAITFTYTLTSSVGGTPIGQADVWVTTASDGTGIVASGTTNDLGVVTFYLDAGTYYVWRAKSGWNFTNPDTEVVA